MKIDTYTKIENLKILIRGVLKYQNTNFIEFELSTPDSQNVDVWQIKSLDNPQPNLILTVKGNTILTNQVEKELFLQMKMPELIEAAKSWVTNNSWTLYKTDEAYLENR